MAKSSRLSPALLRAVRIFLYVIASVPGLLAIVMTAAGLRWLIIEYRQGFAFSLSLALLLGAGVSASVTVVLLWLASHAKSVK